MSYLKNNTLFNVVITLSIVMASFNAQAGLSDEWRRTKEKAKKVVREVKKAPSVIKELPKKAEAEANRLGKRIKMISK